MKIELSTSAKAIHVANMLLAHAIKELQLKPDIRNAFGLSWNDLKDAHAFRKALLKSFTNNRVVLEDIEL